jgi:hypothetical protein
MKAEFSKSGDSWMVMNAQVTHKSGTLSGDVLNRPGDFRMRVNSALNPTELMALCPPKFQHALADWEFQTSPVIQATFSGPAPEFAVIAGTGQIWLGKTKFHGASLNSASANCDLRKNVLRCDQVRVIRDEGVGTGRFICDFGRDQLTIEEVKTNISPGVVATWIDPDIERVLQPFRFSATPTTHAVGTVHFKRGYADDLRIRIETQDPSAYHFDGWEIPFEQGSWDISLTGDDTTNLVVIGTIIVQRANLGKSKAFAPLLGRLEPLGFRELFDSRLTFKFDGVSFRVLSLQLVSGRHAVHLTGSLLFPPGLLDLTGTVEGNSLSIRGVGTLQDPIWQLITPLQN